MRDLVLYGNGTHGELVYALFKEEGYNIVAFTVEEEYITATKKFGLPVVPFNVVQEKYPPSKFDIFVAIGPHRLNSIREGIYQQSKDKGYHLPSFVSRSARVPSEFKSGENSWVDNSSNAHPFVQLGENNVIINSNLGHHSKIGNHCFFSSCIIGGSVIVEDNVFIGIGSLIKSGVKIGRGSVIGMGCIITEDVPPYSVYGERGTKRREVDSRRVRLF